MNSPFSATLRSRPQYALPAGPVAPAPPAITAPTIPALPQLDDARAPNALGRQMLTQRLTNLPGLYNPQLTGMRDQAREALAGYGGWTFRDDDPSTAEREDLAVPTRDPAQGLGAREQQAVLAQRAGAAARGILDSSFANKAVGAALGQLNEEAKSIVRQYAAGVNQIIDNQRTETTDIISDLVRLYGEDARYLADNPPPKPWSVADLPPIPGVNAPAVAPVVDAPPGYTAHGDTLHQNVPSTPQRMPGLSRISTSPTWASDPGYSVAAVEKRWGTGARIVRAGNGKWVVRAPGGGRA